jgi:MYXO-CTERM domain-containing protein
MYRFAFFALFALGAFAPGASAGIIYELIGTGSGNVLATLEFDPATSNATDSAGWSAPGGASLSSLLVGGISGFKVDLGSGLEAATGGDIVDPFAFVFLSDTGPQLDFGIYWDNTNPITFASGSETVIYINTDNLPGQDTISGSNFSRQGDWKLGTTSDSSGGHSVPEPSAMTSLALLGLSGLGVIRRRRRRK